MNRRLESTLLITGELITMSVERRGVRPEVLFNNCTKYTLVFLFCNSEEVGVVFPSPDGGVSNVLLKSGRLQRLSRIPSTVASPQLIVDSVKPYVTSYCQNFSSAFPP